MSFLDFNEKNPFLKLWRFSQNMVSNQQNWISSLMVRAILNIFFCFKGLNESKLLSDQIFLNLVPELRKVKFIVVGTPFFRLILRPFH